ncbi:GTPase-activating protein gyp8 [Taxawa tesnikishii (nom. ined.)]|nr:GTPase-activating protein gyp8 [Dothideales sp. JES 119]
MPEKPNSPTSSLKFSGVLLLVLGANTAAPALARLSLLRIRDFMLPSLTATNAYLGLLPAILRAADPELFAHLAAADVQPHYAIAATLTLYAHDIEEYGSIARLFDFLLAREAVVTVYMYAAILISRRKELFQFEADEPEMLYVTMSKLPKPLNLEALISRTTSLFAQHPPESLPFRAWSRVSGNSVLKTTRDPQKLIKQSLEDGETYFRKHTAEIERQEARQKMLQQTRSVALKYRRPAGALGFAIVVGILSVWLGRNGQLTGSSIFDGLRYRVWDVFNLLLRR